MPIELLVVIAFIVILTATSGRYVRHRKNNGDNSEKEFGRFVEFGRPKKEPYN